MCTAASPKEFFLADAVPIASRDALQLVVSREEQAERGKPAAKLAPKYRSELPVKVA